MGFIMTLVGVGVIAISLFYGFNLYSDSNSSDDPLGFISNPIDSIQRYAAFIVWIIGIVLGLISIGIGRVIDNQEDLKKMIKSNQTNTKVE